ncbi:UDP-4-amino-4,6-dideoxy-N-acetyl-beta-L-altrosamine transaminase [Methanohalophilus sp. DAL1]|jgi:UDP-4-amino-4,6-dideoxy-N-acetyl-beta-L-altrosamine transaminase|uniref:UDP-4-amino-4, 6-dideoxy-N-acetyl-beta-L-altrosamine transaminase n=1 Tax=Methanohalophilus sp. DAL1 TaxID=1864608 RepID=UPI000817F81E|nr:UDP-4-amino-4,6-dideoxy-N-acetyl-beta-L-altrosamine transaminase [Methanohalophilus sp. DAL1]OBZ34778.1 MAG: UDP-4-amino-4,6-dideoxy-N-acetyl-beta-L-altrosamine transaminase [Methanohalophilus sp. DAL1]
MIPYGHQSIDESDIEAVIDVLRSDWLTTGPKVKQFEDSLCEYVGCDYATVVNSGTSALDIAVASLNLPNGSEVITTPFTFVATNNSLIYNNLRPVFADIKKDTRNIDPDDIRSKITSNTKAISYVDYAGQPCEIEEIKEIAEEFDLYLIEDASHALGASYHGKKIGNFADLTVFSFHPVKPITTGEGGAVVTNNAEIAERVRLLHNHGIDKSATDRYGPDAGWAYDMKVLGRNYRMTDIQAALGISQLNKLDDFIERRNEIASLYNEFLDGCEFVETPITKKNVVHGWHIYTVLLDGSINRNEFFKYMRKNEVGVNVHYIPSYHFSYYRNNFNFNERDYPETEDVFNRIVTLPIHPEMKREDVEYVVNTLKEWQ